MNQFQRFELFQCFSPFLSGLSGAVKPRIRRKLISAVVAEDACDLGREIRDHSCVEECVKAAEKKSSDNN